MPTLRLALLFLIAIVPALSQQSVKSMLPNCQKFLEAASPAGHSSKTRLAARDSFDSGACWGAFVALQQYAFLVNDVRVACAPPATAAADYIGLFVGYAQRHPERLHDGFFTAALDAIGESFPCSVKHAPTTR